MSSASKTRIALLLALLPMACPLPAQSSASPAIPQSPGQFPSTKDQKKEPAASRSPVPIYKALTTFLKASSLKERLPYLAKSKRSKKELRASPLAGKLPKISGITLTNRIRNKTLNRREYFYSLSFKSGKNTGPNRIYIQISEWGEHDIPKIHTDAFLDLYGDKLEKFAAKPTDKALTIHAIVDSYRFCFDPDIPDRKNTGFLKVRRHFKEPAFFHAHFKLHGALADQIRHPGGLPWATPGIATITVKWNQDNPKKPYIELIKIDGFTWDP